MIETAIVVILTVSAVSWLVSLPDTEAMESIAPAESIRLRR